MINGAVTKAEHGDFRDLAQLLHPDHPWNKVQAGGWITVRAALAPSAWRLIYDRLTGKHKAKRGRPPKTEVERLFNLAEGRFNPVFQAANKFPYIKQVLRQTYPEQKPRHIRERALEIAARHHAIEPHTLAKYLQRPKTDRRRLISTP